MIVYLHRILFHDHSKGTSVHGRTHFPPDIAGKRSADGQYHLARVLLLSNRRKPGQALPDDELVRLVYGDNYMAG